jgi:hypothetical protein
MSQRLFGLKALAAAAVVSLGAFASSTTAATKDLSAFGWMAEMDAGIDLTVLSTSSNTITLALEKDAVFTSGLNANGEIDPLAIVFRQVSNTAINKIAIVDEIVSNETGVSWSGFRFLLSSPMGGVTFDEAASAGFTAGTQFPNASFTDNKDLEVTGGTLPSGNFPANLYRPGANGDLVINAAPFTSGSTRQQFTFKEQPIVGQPSPVIPLPAAAWTSLSGLLGLGLISNAKNLKKILS